MARVRCYLYDPTDILMCTYHDHFRYVEWEDDLERKRLAAEILNTKKFTPIPGACNRYLQTF